MSALQRRQHGRPNYAATQIEGLLIRRRTGLSDSPHEDQGRGVHTTRAHSPPALSEPRLGVHRQSDLKKRNEKSKQTERRGWRPSRREGRAPPPGVTCALPARVMRASSSCAGRGEASALTRNGGGKEGEGELGSSACLGENVEYPGAARRPAASVTVNQIHCRLSSPPLNVITLLL